MKHKSINLANLATLVTLLACGTSNAQLIQFDPSAGQLKSHIGVGKVAASADAMRSASLVTADPNEAAPPKGSIFDLPDFPIIKPPVNTPPSGGINFPIPTPAPTPAPGPSCSAAQGGKPCGSQSGPASQTKSAPASGAGNPIDVITGNKYQQETDMTALPGVLGLEIVRHYNSAYAVAHAPVDPFGRGWRLSYDTRLYASERTIQIVQADGARVMFNRNPTNPSLCTSGNHSNGWVRVERSRVKGESTETFVWQWTSGRQLAFDQAGKLVQIKEPTGEFVSLSYDLAGRLNTVTDPSSRSLKFQYQPQSKRIASIDSPLGLFIYSDKDQTGKPSDNLTQVKQPTTSPLAPRIYHYEDARWVSHLTGISAAIASAPQRLSTYLYDDEGRGVLSTKGQPAKLAVDASGITLVPRHLAPDTGIEQIHLQHIARATPTQNGTTILANALGETTTYTHRIIAGEYRLLESRGAGCTQCGDTNVRYDYNAVGQIKATHELDSKGKAVVTQNFEYDARGRLALVSSNGRGAKKSISFSYLGDSTLVSEVTQPSIVDGQTQSIRTTYNAYGQILSTTQSGFSPVLVGGSNSSQRIANEITRTTNYQYQMIAGRSLMVRIDGPLPNGPLNSSADSDITTITYDAKGLQVTGMVAPAQLISSVQYDSIGRIGQVKGPSGKTDYYRYFGGSDLIESIVQSNDPLASDSAKSNGVAYRYSALGQIEETLSIVNGVKTPSQRNGFDAAQRLEWQAQSLGVIGHITYDADSRILKSRVHTSSQQQDADFEPAKGGIAREKISHGESTSGAVVRKQIKDDFGRIISITMPDTGATQFGFDSADRMISSSDAAGNRASYTYDPANRITKQIIIDTQGDEQITQWQYSGTRVSKVSHPAQTESYSYDDQGYLASKTVVLSSSNRSLTPVTTRYTYDDTGRLLTMSLPDDTRIRYQRNGQGQVIALQRSRIQTPWLRWLVSDQTIVSDIGRDLIGSSKHTTGNGYQSIRLRDQDGVLGTVAHRRIDQKPNTPSTEQTLALFEHQYRWDKRGNLRETLSQTAGTETKIHNYTYDDQDQLIVSTAQIAREIGALRKVAADAVNPKTTPTEFLMHRYFYDGIGRRLLAQEGINDASDVTTNVVKTSHASFANVSKITLPNGPVVSSNLYDTSGQPTQTNDREYRWNALGQLIQVEWKHRQASDIQQANYRYNHRGERVAKTILRANHTSTQRYLYDHRQIAAELTDEGAISKQYIYLADQLIAMIDYAQGERVSTSQSGESAFDEIASDVHQIVRYWFRNTESMTYLHANHLGAIEAATNSAGDAVWQASYAPFGAIKIQTKLGEHQQHALKLNLRLPGQYEDDETGLYYNDHRYYDPSLGRYLTPDPLGMPDGVNRYAYVRNNPLKYVDPSGLFLFAFDGTGNDDVNRNTFTNVVNFRNIYNDGAARYVTGVGTDHSGRDTYGNIISASYSGVLRQVPDRGGNYSGPDRIKRMRLYFDDQAEAVEDDEVMQVDIIGFSRGAAQARHFANLVTAATQNGYYRYQAHKPNGRLSYTLKGEPIMRCQKVNFRFMGLWDTVLATNRSGMTYQLGIPAQFTYVAQAVALNEYRSAPAGDDAFFTANTNFNLWDDTRVHLPNDDHYGGFALESIGASSNTRGRTRIERGFIGAHADIGGGYNSSENGLSSVALSWMVRQAQTAGVRMDTMDIAINTNNSIIHDQSNVLRFGNPLTSPAQMRIGNGTRNGFNLYPVEDRQVRGGQGGVSQRTQSFGPADPAGYRSLTSAETHIFINYASRPTNIAEDTRKTNNIAAIVNFNNRTGTVSMQNYMNWLRSNGYAFAGRDQ